jgi:hypothetical protein
VLAIRNGLYQREGVVSPRSASVATAAASLAHTAGGLCGVSNRCGQRCEVAVLRKTHLFFELPLCLSRACLGKMIIFIMKRLNKRRFSRLIEDHVRALPCAEEERGAVAKGHDGRVHRHRRDVPVCILQYNGASNILRGKVRALDHVALPPKHHIVIVTTLLADRFRCGERYYTSRRRSHQCAPSLE